MIENIDELKEFREDNEYLPEKNKKNIEKNRRKLLEKLSLICDPHITIIWLKERQGNKNVFKLSYIAPNDWSDRLQSNIGKEVEYKGDGGQSIIAQVEQKISIINEEIIKHAPSFKTFYSAAIPSRVKIDPTEFKKDANILGFIFLATSENRRINDYEELAMDIIQNRFSAIIQQSRILQIKLAGNEVRKIIKQRLSTENTLKATCKLLVEKTGARHAFPFKVLLDNSLEYMEFDQQEKKSEQRLLTDNQGNKIFLHDIFQYNTPTKCSKETKKRINNSHLFIELKINDILFTKVNVAGVDFSDEQTDFLPFRIEGIKTVQHCKYCIFVFSDVHSNSSKSHFTGIDLEITDVITTSVSDYLSAHDFETIFFQVTKFFEKFTQQSSEENKHILNFLNIHIPNVQDFCRIRLSGEYDRNKLTSELLNTKNLPINSWDKALSKVIIDEINNPVKSEKSNRINYLYSSINENSSIAAVLLPLTDIEHELMIFEMKGYSIEITNWELIRHFSHEMLQFLRHQKTIKEINSTMAQTRHAIIGPLSGALGELRAAKTYISSKGFGAETLQSFLSDVVISEGIPKAYHLATQARVLADSAKLLVKEKLDPSDINRNRKFSPLLFIAEIKDALNHEIVRKGLKYTIKTNLKKETIVQGDGNLMWIVMYNLLENAVKYSANNTNINVMIHSYGIDWKYSVENIGGYLPDSKRDQVFEYFYRASQQDHLNKRAGTGIGLAVSKQIILAHSPNGEIDYKPIKGEVGKASSKITFWFKLPISIPTIEEIRNSGEQ